MLAIGCLGAARITPKALIDPAGRRDDVDVVAVAAREAGRAEAFAKEHSIRSIETDYDALVRRADVDAIYNALPPSRHADLTIKALAAGKHVLCEKPLAMNVDEARAMAEAARGSSAVLLEAFHYRFHPAFGTALDLVRGGALGRLRTCRAVFNVEIPERAGEIRHTLAVGGGALMDLGCYPVHWARTLLGGTGLGGTGRVVSARATEGLAGIDLEMSARVEFEGGVMAELETSMAKGIERGARVEVTGDKARLVMINPIAPHMGYRIELWPEGADAAEIIAEAPAGGPATYDYQLAHFVDLVAGRAEPVLPPKDGVANMALIDEIYRAAGMTPRGM